MKFSVLGSNTSASYSPRLHSFVFKILELKHTYSFIEALSIDPKIFIKYDGLNVTNPFKTSIINYLHNMDNVAHKTQSVNCVKIKNNILHGFNTDYFGFSKSLEINNINLSNMRIAVLGAGGVSATICTYLLDNNLNFKVINRTPSNSLKLKDRIKFKNNQIQNLDLVDKNSFDVIINCLPVTVNISKFLESLHLDIGNVEQFIDLNYNSKLSNLGINANNLIDGTDMLIFQALKSIEIWIDKNILQIVDYQIIRDHIRK